TGRVSRYSQQLSGQAGLNWRSALSTGYNHRPGGLRRPVFGFFRMRCMVKFSILFHNPIDPDAFENRYNDLLALLERMPALIRRQVVNVIGSPQGPSPYFRVFE